MTTSFVDQPVLVFVDSSVRDHSALVASISPDAQIIVFDGSRDGVAQISAALAGRSGVSAVHILSHGADGEMELGTTSLTADTLSTYADAIAGWSSALAPGADILLYGCNVAQSHIGRQFVQQIASLTSANVAASTDSTGAAALGGSWTLEYATGSIQAHPVIPADVAYDGVLSVERYASMSWQVELSAPGPGVTVEFNVETGFRADYPWGTLPGVDPNATVANNGIHVGSILPAPGAVDTLSFGDGTSITPYFEVTSIIPTQDVLYGVLVTATGAPITHTYASTTASYVVNWDGETRQSVSNDAFHDQPWQSQAIVDIAPGVTQSPTVTSPPVLHATENTLNQITLAGAVFNNDIGIWQLGTAAEFIGSEPSFTQFAPSTAVAPTGLTLSSAGVITWDLRNGVNPSIVPDFYVVTAMFEAVKPGTQTVISETPYDFLIQVTSAPLPQPLVFNTLPPSVNTVLVGVPQDFVLKASESDAAEVLINYSTLPAGMTVTQTDEGELDIHFDPTSAEIGQSSVVGFTAESFDSNHNALQTTQQVAITFSVDTPPAVQTNAGATDLEGGTITIGKTALNVTDALQEPLSLTYSLIALPTHGQLLLNGVALTTSDTFTQSDINANQITYHQDGSKTTSDSFLFDVSDGAGGSTGQTSFAITIAPCYCPGTLIATPRGEVAVETLAIGDRVVTISGVRPIKWIGRRSYSGRFVLGRKQVLPICIKAGALDENVPRRDLWISPHHAMYLDGVLIEAKDLVNGVSIVQAEQVERVEYFHIELETHDVIIAEGALSESFIDDDSRNMFHNAHEYTTLYADKHVAPALYCAPRLDEGYEVEAVRQQLALRAGLLRAADAPQLGMLRGYIDRIRASSIAGWAQNAHAPEAPVCLDIFAGGKLIGRVLANTYRDDLEKAGFGSGRHGFTFTPQAGLDFTPDVIEVRRSLDGASLECSRPSESVTAYRRAARG